MKAEASGQRIVRRMRVRAVLFLVLALAAGGTAVMLVKSYLDKMTQVKSIVPKATARVVVMAMNVDIATPLGEPHVTLADWPAEHIPEGSFDDIKLVLGRTTRQGLVKGEPVLASRLADEDAGRGLSAILQEGTRAMAVKVNDVVNVGGFVQPGDYVDIIAVIKPDEETQNSLKVQAKEVSKTVLQYIKVLTSGKKMMEKTEGGSQQSVTVVVLEVTPDQAEKLALATRFGKVQLTLRSRIDQELIPTAGVAPVALIRPDEGAEGTLASDTIAKAPEPRRRYTGRRRAAAKPEKQIGPIVEILRGGEKKREELHTSGEGD